MRGIIAATRRCDASWGGKRKAFLLRGLGLRLLGARPVDVEAMGAKMRLHPSNNSCEKRILFTPQYFDLAERAILAPFLTDGVVMLDIGASMGAYSLWAAGLAGVGSRIIAVEPEPQSFARLCFNIAANGHGSIKAVNAAIADVAGHMRLFTDRGNLGGTGVRIGFHSDGTDPGFDAPAITLLQLVENEGLQRIDILKLDVEGVEDIVLLPFLRDADATLLPGVIVLNRLGHRWTGDVTGALRELGYGLSDQTPSNEIWRR
jgi:FkbM family methyltransferase